MTIPEQIIRSLAKQQYTDRESFFIELRKQFSNYEIQLLPKATLLSTYRQLRASGSLPENKSLERMLVKGAVRTLSGVSVITVLTKPFACPGTCVFCPTEPNMPKSYLSNEPAAQRALTLKFDPLAMMTKRIEALEINGHDVDKIEILVLGGTWSFYPRDYQEWFVRQCFYAANTFTPSHSPLLRGRQEGVAREPLDLEHEQIINETARYRIIGLTLETRSDHITPDELAWFRRLGCTRVQIGIQNTNNDVLELNRRGETVEQMIEATKLLKQAGFKVDHHYMPDLPGSTPERDLDMFKRVFTTDEFQPDQIKIYPCVVNEYAQLYHWYKSGKYKPYPEKVLLDLLKEIKKITPPYVRINRLIRDIPEESIVAGNDITNLRQYLQDQLKKEGTPCACIRCREVRADIADMEKAELRIREYHASDGDELFISFESPDAAKIYAFTRLRFNDKKFSHNHFIPELCDAAIIRELHVYGQMTPVFTTADETDAAQHMGFGKKLMAEAENIARERGWKKIAVISGIGVREYYRKLGYVLDGTFMTKKL